VDGSGASIDASNGVYRAGATGDREDFVEASIAGGTAATLIEVSDSPRAPGVVGPPTCMDVDGGGVGIGDVILMLKDVVGLEYLEEDQEWAADFNSDWGVNLADVINALRAVVGLAPIP